MCQHSGWALTTERDILQGPVECASDSAGRTPEQMASDRNIDHAPPLARLSLISGELAVS